jgi:diguanylate cyclase (GGDEF)-like protein
MTGNGRKLDTEEKRFRWYAYSLGFLSLAVAGAHLYLARNLLLREILPVVVFALFIGLAWYLSFSIFPRASLSISLDMAYLMTALCVLPPPRALAVALGGAVLGSVLRARDPEIKRHDPFFLSLCLNLGGVVMTALAGQYLSLLFKDRWQFRTLSWWTLGMIAALFVTYNLTNLAVMGTAVILKREPFFRYLKHYVRYIPSLEVFTIPLCLGLALLYAAAGVWGFVPLASTILVGSGVLKKLNRTRHDLGAVNEQLQNRSRELRILYTIGKDISSSLDPRVVFSRITDHVRRILDAPFVFLSLKHRGPHDPYLEYVARDGRIQVDLERPLGEGFTNWMVEANRPLLLGDVTRDRDSLPCTPVILEESVRSVLAAALTVNNETIGVLCVESPRTFAYGLDQVSVLTTIAQQAAISIENARNFQLAIVDQLTQLFLRDYFKRKLVEEQARARRYGSTFSVLMLDLDSFKEINDRLGHQAGDRFLVRVGEVIKETMRAADTPCRYGGEEFCILLPETDQEGAVTIAERIRQKVGSTEVLFGQDTVHATISVGVAGYPADYPGTLPGLLEKADRALYAAKQSGRDRVVTASSLDEAQVAKDSSRPRGARSRSPKTP